MLLGSRRACWVGGHLGKVTIIILGSMIHPTWVCTQVPCGARWGGRTINNQKQCETCGATGVRIPSGILGHGVVLGKTAWVELTPSSRSFGGCAIVDQSTQLSWKASQTVSELSFAPSTCLLRLAVGVIMFSLINCPHLAHDSPFTVLYAAIISCNS
jgi:hypothetical protein